MRIFIKTFVFFSLMASAMGAFAQIRVNINIGPPPPRREVIIQAPNPGWVWIPGYYAYGGSNWEWRAGRWEAPPSPQHIWVAPRYVRRGDHYDYYEGSWKQKSMKHDNGKHRGWAKQRGRGNEQ
jgi:hypothetical protein